MGHRAKLGLVLLSLASFSACVPYFSQPMSVATLAQHNSGAALVAYLSQPDANPAVCDMRSAEPHITRLHADDSEALVDGLIDGRVSLDVWRACANALLLSAPSSVVPEFLSAAGRGYRTLIKRPDFESSYASQTRLLELHALYLNRSHTLQPEAAVAHELFEELREAHAKKHLGPYATKLATQLLAAYDLEHGRFRGRTLDVAALDALFTAHDVASLQLIHARSSSEQLRDEAKRRIIRLHIAASKYPEVQAHAAEVEETVMRLGNNPQDPKAHRIVAGHLDKLPWQRVSVQQDFARQTASLIGRGPAYDGMSMFPLRGALHVNMKGVSQPITLCADASSLDPTPCVSARHVSLEQPLARIRNNQLVLATGIRIADTLELARSRGKLELLVRVAGVTIDQRALPVRFESVDGKLMFGGDDAGYGNQGPALHVSVDCPDSELLGFVADSGTEQRSAFVHVDDLERFSLEDHGAPGRPGIPGSSGSTGSSGSDCQNGGPGGDGGAGGPGGPGGNGGDVRVEVVCRDGVHAGVGFVLLRDILERVVHSVGGPGGPGGRGGSGGMGGSGGSSRPRRTHRDSNGREWVDDNGCSSGNSGRSGFDGSRGPSGPDGRPGVITISSGP